MTNAYISVYFIDIHVELQKQGNSTTLCGLKVRCGVCATQLDLPTDRQWKAAYFNRSKYSISSIYGRCGSLWCKLKHAIMPL